MLELKFSDYDFRFREQDHKREIYDIIRKRFVKFTPEEWVRQHIIHYFITEMNYPKGLISVEKVVRFNQMNKRYDIVVYNRDLKPWLLTECKEPEVKITNQTLNQLLRYHSVLDCPFWFLTNGISHYCAHNQGQEISWLSSLPTFGL